MSIVNVETGELIEPMDTDSARRLTERIRLAATNYTEAKAKVMALVDEAKAGHAHIALGYASWSAYLSDVLSDEPLRLARDEQRELTVRLADEGMSSRAIAPIVGAGVSTVKRDIAESTGPDGPVVRETEGLDGRVRTTVTAGRTKPRTDVAHTINRVLMQARYAADAADQISSGHLAGKSDEATVWSRDLIESIGRLQGLLTRLEGTQS